MLRKSGRLRAGDLTCKGNPTKVSLAYIPFLAIYRSAHGQQNLWAITKKDFKRNLEVLFLLPVNRCATTVSVHKEVFSYERLVATSVMEAAAFSLSMVDHGLDDSAIASISFMVARSTSPTPVK